MSEQEYNHIVRLAGHDIEGQEILLQGIAKVKGVGLRMAKTIIQQLGFEPSRRLGYLTQKEISSIEEVIKDPINQNLPD